MDKEILSFLKELRLGDVESEIYLHLVRNSLLTAYKISKDIGIHRSNTYNLLEKLKQRGFVNETIKNNVRYYSAKDLTNVLGRLKTEESLILKLKDKVEHIQQQALTRIDHLEAKGAFAQFNTKMYYLAKNNKLTFIYMISNSPKLTTRSSNILIKKILNDLKKEKNISNIDSRAIWDEKFRNKKFTKQFEKLGFNRFLPELQNKATTFIYDNHVSFVYLENNEEVIEINNEQISNEMKKYFEYLWKLANK